MASSDLRIVSLLPSATEIVGALGLGEHLVGVTHECDVCPDEEGLQALEAAGLARVTTSEIDPETMTQSDIDAAVQRAMQHRLALYTVDEAALRSSLPTVVLTQALCAVCAPAYDDVAALCQRLDALTSENDGALCEVVNLEPDTMASVGETFVTVAAACGVRDRGVALREDMVAKLKALDAAVAGASERPKVALLEWLAPPFDGGHWVPDQIRAAGADPVLNARGGKSQQRSWSEVQEADPDVIVVACCGFDLARNLADTRTTSELQGLRAWREGRVFALDGNRYFARPSPSLVEGAAIVARCAHAGDSGVVERLEALSFMPTGGWAQP